MSSTALEFSEALEVRMVYGVPTARQLMLEGWEMVSGYMTLKCGLLGLWKKIKQKEKKHKYHHCG